MNCNGFFIDFFLSLLNLISTNTNAIGRDFSIMGDRLGNKIGSKICVKKVWFALLELRSIGIEDENNK
jgi:hypothetical protein